MNLSSNKNIEYAAELRGIAYDLRRWSPPSTFGNVAASSLERIAWEMESEENN